MADFVECRHCSSELRFIQEPPDAAHKWRAVCTKCRTKKGEAKLDSWVNDETIAEILKMHPNSNITRYKRARFEKQRHEALVAKLTKATEGMQMLSAEDEAAIQAILDKKK